jgi:hypothetical protein
VFKEYVKIYCCGDCVQYDWKKHKCRLGATEEGLPHDRFYRDCPLGICKEETEDCEREELIECARKIKEYCIKQCHDCKDCPFSYDDGNGCKLTNIDDYPTRWDLPEEMGDCEGE